jgi:DNA polymerase III psi subunit
MLNNMKVDNPGAFRFIMQDELYLLPEDKVAQPGPFVREPVSTPAPAAETPLAKPLEPVAASQTVAITLPPQPIKTPEPSFNYVGNNNKHFLILVNYQSEEFIAPAHLAALENILKRKDLALDDVAIFNVNKYQPITITKIAELLKPSKMVIMGKDALPQGIGNLPLNSPVQGKKTHVLYSFSFDEMMSSNENKKAFWDQMKTL